MPCGKECLVNMDINVKEIITETAEKLLKDENLRKQFMDDPVEALEKLLNIDLPNELLDPVVEGIKAKLTVDTVQDVLGDASKLLKKLF